VATRNVQSPATQTDTAPEVISFGPFRIIPHERRLERDGTSIPLGSRAFDLLALLVSRPGEILSKGELMARAWPDTTVDEGSLRFHIAQLRRALNDGQDGDRYVTNVPGRGYCFVASVDRSAPAPPKQASTAEVAPNLSLPPRPSRLVGRDKDVRALGEHLSTRRFVTLRGPGGIGKTTIAIALAHELGEHFRDGVRFIDLGSLRDSNLVATAVASALRLLVPVEDPTPRLIEALHGRQMLLVFDSCEHVVEATARLAQEIHQHAPGVALLTTSREALEATGEFVFEIAPLEIPPDDLGDKADLARYSSARLFMECAVAAGYSAVLTDADAKIVAQICRKLDGMPLAIELVARLSAHGLNAVTQLIQGRLRLTWRGRRTAPLRHQSLSAALDWSYELISPAERYVLESLSIFPGAFTLQGALAVAGGSDDSDSVMERLEQLVAKSLVASRPSAGQARFRLLETTRAYAAEKLAASGEARAASLRHARFVLQALVPRSYEAGGERPGGFAHRAELLPDARSALAWAFSEAGEVDLRIPLAAACARLFVELALLEECRFWADQAQAAAGDAPAHRAAKVELLWALGHATMFTDRNSYECEAALRRGLKLAQELGDLQNQFRLLSRLHALYRRTGERKSLAEVAHLAEAVASELNDLPALARAHTYVGIAHQMSGDQQLARERLQAGEAADAAIPSLPVDHYASPRGTNVFSCTNLWLLGYPDRAVAVANRLMDEKSNPDLAMYCGGLCFAARVFRWVGDVNALEQAADRLANHARKHGFGPFQTVALALRGELELARGQIDQGVELLQQSLPRMLADRLQLYSGAVAGALVEGLAAQGRVADAAASIEAEIKAVATQGDRGELPELLRIRGRLRAQGGDITEAERDLVAAMELAERQSSPSWKLRAALTRARLAGASEAAAPSLTELFQTYERFTEGFDTADLHAARELLRERLPKFGSDSRS
jgi:predicted ATPase/DNA-binding winged helix-turn-helix (wHTH) protein